MLLPVYGVALVRSLVKLDVEIRRTIVGQSILPEGLDFPRLRARLGRQDWLVAALCRNETVQVVVISQGEKMAD